MKSFLSLSAIFAASLSLASAGDWGKAPVVDKAPVVVDYGCPCYAPGFEFSGFAAGLFPSDSYLEDAYGGGASVGYFFTQNLGIEFSYSAVDAHPSVEHVATANLVYRFVNEDSCFAPYVMVGGGALANSHTRGLFDVGAGLDIRFEDWNCVGLFADATYNWTEDDEEFVLVRAGFRVPF